MTGDDFLLIRLSGVFYMHMGPFPLTFSLRILVRGHGIDVPANFATARTHASEGGSAGSAASRTAEGDRDTAESDEEVTYFQREMGGLRVFTYYPWF